MATESQKAFFKNLTNDRDFGTSDINVLLREFDNLSDKSASKWIERALELPEKGEVKPTF